MNTFIIIKPDAIERGLIGTIISRFEQKGFTVDHIKMAHKNAAWTRAHYAHLERNTPFYMMGAAMIKTPLIGILLEGPPNIIKTVRTMVGATNPMEAAPGTIRGDYATEPVYCNLIHASDSEEAVEREWQLFCNPETTI